jgi:indoleamine 2,3-dioxygenase
MRSPTYQPAGQRQRLSFSHPNRNGLFAATSSTAQPTVALPPGHFLSLPATHATPSPATAYSETHTSAQTVTPHLAATNLAPNVSTTASADFEVDVRTGFLPFDAAVERLPPGFDVWEEALWAARGEGVVGQNLRLGGDGLREQVWRKGIEEVSLVRVQQGRCLWSYRCPSYRSRLC